MTDNVTWGSVKGEVQKNKPDYVKMKQNGSFKLRIVSNPLPRHVYWIENKALGFPATFDNIRFSRTKEIFINGIPDPIADMNIVQKNPWTKKDEVISSKKNYLAWAVDRSDNKLKLLEVKPTLIQSMVSIMKQLGPKGLKSPMDIDLVITRSGEGTSTKYEIEQISALDALMDSKDPESNMYKQLLADEAILGTPIKNSSGVTVGFSEVTPLEEVFPMPTDYETQKAEVLEFLAKVKENKEESQSPQAADADKRAVGEVAGDLDD